MKILYSPASPYSAKVRMAAQYTGLPVESELVKTDDQPALLVDNNPLGKIPVLLREEGSSVFDSRAIMQFLDRASGGKLYPNELTGGHIALAALSGYLQLRFAGQWETFWPGHGAFIAEFESRFPAYAEFKPKG